MLPAAARLTSGESFRRCVRTGRRAGSRHGRAAPARVAGAPATSSGHRWVSWSAAPSAVPWSATAYVAGLRHLVRDQLADLPAASTLVVRALPAAADASYGELRDDLGRCLERVLPTPERVGPRRAGPREPVESVSQS